MTGAATQAHDLHVHSTLSDGRDEPAVNAHAAAEAGLGLLVMVEHVRRESTHVPAIVAAARELDAPGGLRVRAGVEAKLLDDRGHLDCPDDLTGVDVLAVADHQLPSPVGPVRPDEAARLIDAGDVGRAEAIGWLIDAMIAAAHAHGGGRATTIVHPFSLLPKMGLSEEQIGERTLRRWALEMSSAGAAVEVSERWTCPSQAVARLLDQAGVELVRGSDAHRSDHVGAFRYVDHVLAGVDSWAPGPVVAGLS